MARPRAGSELSIAQLKEMLADRSSQIAALEKEKKIVYKVLRDIDVKISRLGGTPSRGRRGGGGRMGGGIGGRVKNEMNLADSIEKVLTGGGAKGVGEIVDAVLEIGYRTNAENFRNIVNQVLIKEKRFASPGRGMYQMKK
jgi:hypothetical protein